MTSVRVQHLPTTGSGLEPSERELGPPGRGEVVVRVEACGVCHSDVLSTQLAASYPIVPGHEIAGVVDSVGDGVEAWGPGDRVGVGWYGGIDRTCPSCRSGDFIDCAGLRVPGLAYDGGYAEYMLTPTQGLAPIPDIVPAQEAGPVLCAGVTTFNALRHSGALAGDLVAVQGLGGLGHLGVQFANKLGFETVAIGRGQDKREMVLKLGAHHYIDTEREQPARTLSKLGGAKTILATAPDAKSMTSLIDGLGTNGVLLVVGASQDSLQANPIQLIMQSRAVQGWASGISTDSEDTLRFCAFSGVRPMIETFPLTQAAAAYERMMSGKARFRVVLVTGPVEH